jgi:hypothetical protein
MASCSSVTNFTREAKSRGYDIAGAGPNVRVGHPLWWLLLCCREQRWEQPCVHIATSNLAFRLASARRLALLSGRPGGTFVQWDR